MAITHNIGMILLSLFLIFTGINILAGAVIPAIVIGIVAIAAAIFILIGR